MLAKAVGGKSGGAKGELEITNLTDQHKQTVEQLEHHLIEVIVQSELYQFGMKKKTLHVNKDW